MDILAEVLETLHLKSKLHWCTELRAPWGLHIETSPDMPFHLVTHGRCWLRILGEPDLLPLAEGDLALLPHGLAHDLLDQPISPTTQTIEMRYADHEGETLLTQEGVGALTKILCGTVHFDAGVGPPLIPLLPPVIHIKREQEPADGELRSIIRILTHEASRQLSGTEIIRARLTDIVFVYALRVWLESQSEQQRWLGALRDPQIGAALLLMQREPETRWTIERLAAEVGLSRSAFSERFTALVGTSPLQYLKQQRLLSAARMLREGEMTVAQIAPQVGYETEAALSKAFKQAMGVSPRAYRRQMG
jgi:AraC-like DNA-binding protein